jgi:hypothetical protein
VKSSRPAVDDDDSGAQTAPFELLGGPGADPLVAEEDVSDAQDERFRLVLIQL